MMKKIFFTLTAAILSASMTLPAFADWKQDNLGWRYENSAASYATDEWKELGGNWYYFDDSGYMTVNRWVGHFYVGSDGVMLKNTSTPDGYNVGNDGAWIQDTQFSENEKQFWNDVAEVHYYSMKQSETFDPDTLDYFMGIFISTSSTVNIPLIDWYTQVDKNTYNRLINNIFGGHAADQMGQQMWERSTSHVLIPAGDFGVYFPRAEITEVSQIKDGKVMLRGIARGMGDIDMVVDSMNFEMVLTPASDHFYSAYQLESITYH